MEKEKKGKRRKYVIQTLKVCPSTSNASRL